MGDEHEGKGIRSHRLKSEVSKKFAVRVKASVWLGKEAGWCGCEGDKSVASFPCSGSNTTFAGMKRKRWILLSSFFCVASCLSAQGIDSLFAKVPQQILPLLNRTSKLDLLDLYNSGLPAKAENLYGGQSEMTKKTADFLSLKTTESGEWQMKMLPYEDDSMLVCVYSHKAVGTSSVITAYRCNWTKLKLAFPRPSLSDFWLPVNPLSQMESQMLNATLQEVPIEVSLCDSAALLTYRVSLEGLSKENREQAVSCVKPLTYAWDAGRKLWIKREEQAKEAGK